MTDLIVAVGLVLVIEGMLWALIPGTAVGVLRTIAEVPESHLRAWGAAAVAAGVGLVWLIRG